MREALRERDEGAVADSPGEGDDSVGGVDADTPAGDGEEPVDDLAYVRVPFADLSVHPLSSAVDLADAVLLADIFPTAYEVGVLNGHVAPGDTVVVVGVGPIGLATIATARLYTPGRIIVVDLADPRLAAARNLGADATANADEGRNSWSRTSPKASAPMWSSKRSACPRPSRCAPVWSAGGRVANVGVHGKPAALHLEDLWIKDVTITTGLVDTYSTPLLLRMMAAGKLPSSALVTHRFELGQMEEAYDVFSRAATPARSRWCSPAPARHRDPARQAGTRR